MSYPTESTYVELNGKRYLLCVGGNVRLQVKRNWQYFDRWFAPDTKIAQRVAAQYEGN